MEENINVNVLYEVALNKIMQLQKENLELNTLLIQKNDGLRKIKEESNIK